MNLLSIFYFVCVAEELSFSRAAEKYYVSQSAISRQIQQLEKELGVQLLSRSHHHVRLTEAGEACLPIMRRICADCNLLMRQAKHFDTRIQGRVCIAYPNVATLSLLSDTMRHIRAQHPLVEISPLHVTALNLVQVLDEGTADMAIALLEMVRTRQDLSFVPLKRGKMMAVVPRNHELAEKMQLHYEELLAYPLILHEMSPEQLRQTGMYGELSAHGIDYDQYRHGEKTEDILLSVSMGEGLGLMPGGFFCFHLSSLVYIPIVDSVLDNDVVLTWKTDMETPAMQSIAQYTSKAFTSGALAP